MRIHRKLTREEKRHIEKERIVKNIAFLGYSEADPKSKLYQQVFDVASVVAKNGYTIVNGGGPGVMRASTEGAHYGGGRAIGITFFPKDATHFEGHDPDNRVDELVETKNYLERTLKLLEYGDIYIIFNGGTGTISEFGMAWGLARLYFGHHKPFILFGDFWYSILEAFAQNMLLREEELQVYKIVTKIQDVVPTIKEFEIELDKVKHDHAIPSPFRL